MNQIIRLCLALAGALAGFLFTGARAASTDNYTLQPNDLVQIKVFQEPDLTTTARVAADGTISFPLIGTVGIGGRTVSGAAGTIRSALAKDYLVDPQVSLTVTDYAKRRFTVLGQVQKGGTL